MGRKKRASLKRTAKKVRDENADAIYADAAAGTDVVILPLPWNAMDQTLGQL
jgi:predicted dinucleotide-binding enzyme